MTPYSSTFLRPWKQRPKNSDIYYCWSCNFLFFAVVEVCSKKLARPQALTACTRIIFKKANKAKQMHGAKKLSSVICSADILLQITFKWFFSSVTKSSLWHQELLNFHKPLPLYISTFLGNENNMGEWSVDKAVKLSVLLQDSYKLFETTK